MNVSKKTTAMRWFKGFVVLRKLEIKIRDIENQLSEENKRKDEYAKLRRNSEICKCLVRIDALNEILDILKRLETDEKP
jgi:hypothetical protein